MDFLKEFHVRGKLSNDTFTVLIVKKTGVEGIRDFWPVSLILSKLLAFKLQKVLHYLITAAQGVFVCGRQVLDDILIANECINHSRNRVRRSSLLCKLDLVMHIGPWKGL